MKISTHQSGVTLLEVLIGFVIFTTSLVALLDYVSGQVYHTHRTAQTLQAVKLIHDWSSVTPEIEDQRRIRHSDRAGFEYLISSSAMESVNLRKREILLNRYSYSVGDREHLFAWTVIRID